MVGLQHCSRGKFQLGTVSAVDGSFLCQATCGEHSVVVSIHWVFTCTQIVVVDSSDVVVDFSLEIDAIAMTALEVLASRVMKQLLWAYTTIVKEDMEVRLGSQDIPMILNTTPSVYATQQGGGVGDVSY